jgi:hypothetical protein
MFKDTITYVDFNGEETTEDFFFHLSASDIARIELSHSGRGKAGMVEELNRIIKKQNGAEIVAAFETFVLDSYGVKSDDGRRFIKTAAVYEEFRFSNAYDVFFIKLVTDAEFGAKFINGLLPEDLQAKAKVLMEQQQNSKPSNTLKSVPEPLSREDFDSDQEIEVVEVKRPGREKQRRLSREEILAGMRAKSAPRVLTEDDVLNMSQEDLDAALDAGATIDGL